MTDLKGVNYVYSEEQLKLSNGNYTYTFGDKIKITVASVILDERKVNFILNDN